jgi:WhiB family redox-sensing transcriptional regulator
MFFPDGAGKQAAYVEAKKVCARCAVREQCLKLSDDFEATGDRHGVFGGLTPDERRELRRLRDYRQPRPFLFRLD